MDNCSHVVFQGSPGNISQFEDVLFSHCTDTNQSFGVAAVTVSHTDNNISVALALADQTSRVMTVSEFLDNDRYSNLEVSYNGMFDISTIWFNK